MAAALAAADTIVRPAKTRPVAQAGGRNRARKRFRVVNDVRPAGREYLRGWRRGHFGVARAEC